MTSSMMTNRIDTLGALGLCWQPSGQAGLRGPLRRLAEDADEAFRLLAAYGQAQEEWHPAVDGDVPEQRLYQAHRGEDFTEATYLSSRYTRLQQAESYEPLARQHSYTVREIVCIGDAVETVDFLDRTRTGLTALLAALELPTRWVPATDTSPQQALLDRLEPRRHDAIYGDDLVICTLNLHHEQHARAFGLTRNGAPASTASVEFAIEPWLSAIIDRHGADPVSWPQLEQAAEQVGEVW